MTTQNLTQPDSSRHNLHNGQEVAKQSPKSQTARSISRSHSDYWKARLFRPSYTRDGKLCEVNDLAIRIQHGGRRETFCLSTTNKDAAAIKARDIWTSVKGGGWDSTLAKFKPDAEGQPKINVTVGDYLAAVEATRKLANSTFLSYRNCLRTIIAEAFEITPQKSESKFDYRGGGKPFHPIHVCIRTVTNTIGFAAS